MRWSDRWRETWRPVGVEPPVDLLRDLTQAYSEPHRAYHTVAHLDECFAHLDRAPLRAGDPFALELALWFHDAIYDPRADDNEARSAAWARDAVRAHIGDARVEAIERMILATRHDGAPNDDDAALLIDVDLSILGADEERFSEYEQQIRIEYSWVPEDPYRTARSDVLRSFLDRPQVYHTAWFRSELEARARENLQRSLDALAR